MDDFQAIALKETILQGVIDESNLDQLIDYCFKPDQAWIRHFYFLNTTASTDYTSKPMLMAVLRQRMSTISWERTDFRLNFFYHKDYYGSISENHLDTRYMPERCHTRREWRVSPYDNNPFHRNTGESDYLPRQSSFKPSPSQGYHGHKRV